jgi:hypothetical protein
VVQVGTSTSSAEFAGKISAAGRNLGQGVERGVRRASLDSKKLLVNKAIRPMSGGDQRLSGARNAKISLNYKISGSGERTTSRFKVRGPIMLVEADVPAHKITPRRKYARGGRRGGRRSALKFGGQYATHANHPGTKGKGLFKKVRDNDVPTLAGRIIFENTANQVLDTFR